MVLVDKENKPVMIKNWLSVNVVVICYLSCISMKWPIRFLIVCFLESCAFVLAHVLCLFVQCP